jgi:hypothetical protein
VALVATGTAVSALAACDSGGPSTAPTAPPTPIARLNSSALTIPRIDFCGLVPRAAVRQALGVGSWDRDSWGNGEHVDVAGAGSDVVAEHGCRWRARTGNDVAAAWVFARPVDRSLARLVLRQAGTATSCRVVRGPAFGDPSVTQLCTAAGSTRVRHAGLFGDTWLTCEVTRAGTETATRVRADAWCVEVANALNTSE